MLIMFSHETLVTDEDATKGDMFIPETVFSIPIFSLNYCKLCYRTTKLGICNVNVFSIKIRVAIYA